MTAPAPLCHREQIQAEILRSAQNDSREGARNDRSETAQDDRKKWDRDYTICGLCGRSGTGAVLAFDNSDLVSDSGPGVWALSGACLLMADGRLLAAVRRWRWLIANISLM